MRFASLGSGSKGNATIVQQGGTHVMLDCGFSTRELKRRLGRLGMDIDDLDAVLLTHEHSDHVSGIGPLCRKYDLPVFATAGTWRMLDVNPGGISQKITISAHEAFQIGEMEIQPFPVPHDAKEPCQFVFYNGSQRLGVLTDTGRITPHIDSMLSDCSALVLECNHDAAMLQQSNYPWSLKQRVSGDLGHLSNTQAAEFVAKTDFSTLQHFVAAHLSEKNNHPDVVRHQMASALGCSQDWIQIIDQQDGLGWRDLVEN